MDDPEEFRKQIEEKILKIIQDRLISQKMEIERARGIAQYILDTLHPHMTLQQIYEVSQQFDEHFSELMPIVTHIHRDYDDQIRAAVTNHVSELIKQGKITEATDLVKKGINRELKLSE